MVIALSVEGSWDTFRYCQLIGVVILITIAIEFMENQIWLSYLLFSLVKITRVLMECIDKSRETCVCSTSGRSYYRLDSG